MQIDLAPTLSVLLGLPIPKNNLGQVLQGVLEAGGVPVESVLELLYFNSLQIVKLMEANIPGYKYGKLTPCTLVMTFVIFWSALVWSSLCFLLHTICRVRTGLKST